MDVARDGIHPAEFMPFSHPWTDVPTDELPLNFLQWWAHGMATWSRDAWALDLCAL